MATLCQGSAILILGLFCIKCSAECSITNEIFAYMAKDIDQYFLGGSSTSRGYNRYQHDRSENQAGGRQTLILGFPSLFQSLSGFP